MSKILVVRLPSTCMGLGNLENEGNNRERVEDYGLNADTFIVQI